MIATCNSKKCTGRPHSSRGVVKEMTKSGMCSDCGHALTIKRDAKMQTNRNQSFKIKQRLLIGCL